MRFCKPSIRTIAVFPYEPVASEILAMACSASAKLSKRIHDCGLGGGRLTALFIPGQACCNTLPVVLWDLRSHRQELPYNRAGLWCCELNGRTVVPFR